VKFLIDMVRISYGFREFEVEAETEDEAREKALDVAGDYEFNEKNAEYRIDWMGKKEEQ
jgi:hypothetical protein